MTAARFDSGRPRSLQDHQTPAGDVVQFSYRIRVLDKHRGELHSLVVHVHMSEAYSMVGTITAIPIALQVLDHARDAVAGYHMRKGGLVVPGKDASIDGIENVASIEVDGPIENREYTLALFKMIDTELRNTLAKSLKHRADHALTVKAL